MNDTTITLPAEFVARLLKHGTDFNIRLKHLDELVNEYLLTAALNNNVTPSKSEAMLTVVHATVQQSRRNNGVIDPLNRIPQIKAFREVVGQPLFPEVLRRALRASEYLSHGCQQPGLAEGKRFVEDNWVLFQREFNQQIGCQSSNQTDSIS